MKKQLRHLIYRLKYRFGIHLNLKTPIDVSLELASVCNMKCGYCYHGASIVPFTKGIMERQLAFEIISQAFDLKVPSIKFNYRGESTLNPDFRDILLLAQSYNKIDPSVFQDRISNSNFKFNTKNNEIFEGLASLTKIKVSYDSFNKEVFEKQRAGGNHEGTTKNINKFYEEYFDPDEQELVIQAVITKANEREDLEGELNKRWPLATISCRPMVSDRLEKDVSSNVIKERDFSNRQSCLQAHVRIIFDHEGNSQPCCPAIDKKKGFEFGNIKDKSLYDIFNDYHLKQLRKDLKNKTAFENDPCKTCSSYESFKGFTPSWNS